MAPAPFSCECGALHGQIEDHGLRAGTHLECFCPDCRAAQLYFDQPDPAPGAVELFQTTPDAITIHAGSEHLAMLRLGPKGLYRWYAGCCNTPLFNTLKSRRFAFAGILADRLEDNSVLGPIRVQGYVPTAGKPPRHKGAGRMAYGIFSRMIGAWVSGRWRQTPFFDPDTGKPVAEPVVISREDRARLYR
ncbi:MAG: hypothetical protein GJ676_07700 [Rhodobacteraceae bacterium]|nr:hypothetical protein [Paracoccaceae bacterium]